MGRTGHSRCPSARRRPWQRITGSVAALGFLLAAAAPVRAGRVTDLASTFDEKGAINASLKVGYQRSLKRGSLKREYEGLFPSDVGGFTTSGVATVKELRFTQVRNVLDLRADLTLFKALQVYLALPLILQDTRSFDFAQNGGDPCGDPPELNCVTPLNSTLVRDGLLSGAAMGRNQVAVGGPDLPPGGLLLPNRAGLDQLHLGLQGAPLSQQRDPSKPTWVIGFEARLAVGTPMEYNPALPTANTAVGRGVHELMWWTAVSRRFRYLEPWMSVHYVFPQATGSSLYSKTSFPLSGQERSGPQQRGGAEAGLEIIPWEQPQHHRRITVELSARVEGVFEGRGYSDVWELFANQARLAGPCVPNASSINPKNWNNGTHCSNPDQTVPFPGITNIENYAVYGGSFAVGVEITRYLRGRIGVNFAHEGSHTITFGDPGRAGGDLNVNTASKDCLSAGPSAVCLADERQVNPMYRPLLDGTGHRFRVDETTLFDFFVSLQGQF